MNFVESSRDPLGTEGKLKVHKMSEDIQDDFWVPYIQSICFLCPERSCLPEHPKGNVSESVKPV